METFQNVHSTDKVTVLERFPVIVKIFSSQLLIQSADSK